LERSLHNSTKAKKNAWGLDLTECMILQAMAASSVLCDESQSAPAFFCVLPSLLQEDDPCTNM